jgi:hypothetical protein
MVKLYKIWKGVIRPVLEAVFSVIKIFFDICFLIVLCYGILCIPLLADYHSYVVEDSLNEANIKKGSLVYYKKVQPTEILQDDIIVYKPAMEMIFHKVMRVIPPSDENTNNTQDYTYEVEIDSYHKEYPNNIAYKDILGEVAPIYLPFVGYFVNFIQLNMPLFYIIIGISAVDLLLSFLPSKNK